MGVLTAFVALVLPSATIPARWEGMLDQSERGWRWVCAYLSGLWDLG